MSGYDNIKNAYLYRKKDNRFGSKNKIISRIKNINNPDNPNNPKITNEVLILHIDNEYLSLPEASAKYNISETILKRRYTRGARDTELLNPVQADHALIVALDGETRTLKELSQMSGIKIGTILMRYRSGKRGRDLIKPVKHILKL